MPPVESEAAEPVRCSLCGSKDVRESFPKPFIDAVMALFRLQPHRCRSCNHRFYWRLAPGEQIPIPADKESSKRT